MSGIDKKFSQESSGVTYTCKIFKVENRIFESVPIHIKCSCNYHAHTHSKHLSKESKCF